VFRVSSRTSVGGLTNVIVTQYLLNSAQGSRQKYMLHLELKRSESEKKEKGEKRKAVEMACMVSIHVQNELCTLNSHLHIFQQK
jgi:hypothetical protein